MKKSILISEKELNQFGEINNLSQKAEALLNHQKNNWELVKLNFDALQNVKVKNYKIDNLEFRTQFNPSRIISSSAKVDKKSIENRACFLCEEKLPIEQKGIDYKEKYVILCNPYPIFKQHLTIPKYDHVPQNVNDAFTDLLDLAFDLKENFFVFYNGPRCGASAPDHLHFQAGEKNSTPLEGYYKTLIEYSTKNSLNGDLELGVVKDSLYKFLFFQSDNKELIISNFAKLLKVLLTTQNSAEEPLLNIICFYEDGKWNLIIIPRKIHRPKQYFRDDENKLLISPASVDMMGLLITPRKEDFEEITKEEIKDIYHQVLFDEQFIDNLLNLF